MKKKQVLIFLFIFFITTLISFLNFLPVKAREPYIKINNGETLTVTRRVVLNILSPNDAVEMKISNSSGFEDAKWEAVRNKKTWCLDYGSGNKYVYVRFKSSSGDISSIYQDYIKLDVATKMDVSFNINSGESETFDKKVKLNLKWSRGVEIIKVSEDKNFKDASWEPVTKYRYWLLSSGAGEKTVYIKFKDASGKEKVLSNKIKYSSKLLEFEPGTLLKGVGSEVFYFGYDQKLHPIYNEKIFFSWFESFDKVNYISESKIDRMQIGEPLCPRPGTWLLKFKGLSDIYTVEPGCVLTHLRSPAEASIYYGLNWGSKVIELDTVLRSYFTINFPNATNVSEEDCEFCVDEKETTNNSDFLVHKICKNDLNYIVDYDKDGVSEEIEKEYGTSDKSKDTDRDGLSDYEEIYYLFSDPKKADTDGDGFPDGKEVINSYSPNGPKKIDFFPENSYIYPKGTIFQSKKDKYYYYRANDGKFYFISRKTTDKNFKANNFNEKFVIKERIQINFTKAGNLSSNFREAFIPQILNDSGKLIDL
jgi:hypothetical protein